MFLVFLLLFMAALIATAVGLVRPSVVLRRTNSPTRATVIKVFGSASLLLFVAMLVTVPDSTPDEVASTEEGAGESEEIELPASAESSRPAGTALVPPSAAPIAAPASEERGFGPGTHLVGTDIQPGRYRSEGPVTYLARLSGLGGHVSDIVANEASVRGPVVVDIDRNDVAFRSQGGGRWVPVDETYRPSLRSSFGDGWWIVGRDIEPGTYRTQQDVSYYARLRGFGHDISDIIANEARSVGGSIVDIRPTDAGFVTKGGATWTKIQ